MENSVPGPLCMQRSQCLLGRCFNLILPPSANSDSPRWREGTEQKVYPLLLPLLCSLCSPCSVFYLSDLAFVSLPDVFPAKQGWFLCLYKYVLFFVLVNKQKNKAYLMMYFVCVPVRRETKEGNTKSELQAYINYVSESTPDTR